MRKKLLSDSAHLIWLCAAVYFCSYVTRINYSAVLVEIISAEGFARSAASAALTGLFITYGIGQVISGFMGDRLPPQMLIFCGLLVSAGMNILIPLCPGAAAMTVVWCINGFAQAMMWPPLVRIMSEHLTEERYKKATVYVSWGSSFGTIFIYFIAPVCITGGGWRSIFFMAAVISIAMALIWLIRYRRLSARMDSQTAYTPAIQTNTTDKAAKTPLIVYGLLGAIMLAIVMQGILRDGITTWMPSYISETFNLGSSISILTGVALPVFSIITFKLTELLNSKLIKNELLCSASIFAVAVPALIILRLISDSSVVASVILLTLSVGCMHGINLILICIVPKYFMNTGKTSLISGVLNSCTYIGSALSTYGIAVLTDSFGWNVTLPVWAAVALIGLLACLIPAKKWQRFSRNA